MSFRPSIENVATPEIRAEGSLKIESQYRSEVATHLSEARKRADVPGIAFAAFTLAYSYDHSAPYDFEQARILIGEALAYYPEWPEALFNRGVVHIHLRTFPEAIQDFEEAERAFDKADPLQVVTAQERILTKGKLLIFQAEAYCGRAKPGDLEMARANLIRAESYLLKIVDHTGKDPSARIWIEQIPTRLKATIPATPKQDVQAIRHPLAFLIGLITVPLLMWWMVYVTTPREPLNPANDKSHSQQSGADKRTPTVPESVSKTPSPKSETTQSPELKREPKKTPESEHQK